MSGSPHNWRGSRFSIGTSRRDEQDDESLQLREGEGEWSDDTMRLHATVHAYKIVNRSDVTDRSGAGIKTVDPVVDLVLRRGSRQDFTAACARIMSPR